MVSPMTMVSAADSVEVKLLQAIESLQTFGGADLGSTLARIELSLQGVGTDRCETALADCGIESHLLNAAGLVKHLAGQINVIIHALGILLCLPHILQDGEVIEYLSLGAGNTGKEFDLETNQRIAEFKFIQWRGGPEAIRQNALFKDFYVMAEYPTDKQKFLYVLGTTFPLKFFNSGRALSSILSRHVKIHDQFIATFGEQYQTVRDYYIPRRDRVTIQDLSSFVPELVAATLNIEESL